MRKIFTIALLMVLLSLIAKNAIELNTISGKLLEKEGSWFIQTETDSLPIYFAEKDELLKRKIILSEQDNFSCKYGILNEKNSVFEFTILEITTKLRDDKGELAKLKKRTYTVDPNACIGCNICPGKCPVNAISMVNGKAVINADECINCGICADVCPVGAISK